MYIYVVDNDVKFCYSICQEISHNSNYNVSNIHVCYCFCVHILVCGSETFLYLLPRPLSNMFGDKLMNYY